jgi:hypothetical protein
MTSFEERLREDLDRSTSGIELRPGLAGRAHRRRRRRIAARIATATAVTAVLAVSAGAVAAAQSGPASAINRSEAALTALVTEDPVISVSSPDWAGGVGFTRTGTPVWYAQVRQWYYGGLFRMEGLTPAGQPVYDYATAENTETNILYEIKTWWHGQIPDLGGSSSGTTASAPTCASVKYFGADGSPLQWAPDINEALHCGLYKTAGTDQVDGMAAIKLVPVNPDHLTAVLWLSPSTYLPVKIAVESVDGSGPATLQHTEYVNWLAPTAANLALLAPRAPAGFTEIPGQPAMSCASSDQACQATFQRRQDAWYAKYLAPRFAGARLWQPPVPL